MPNKPEAKETTLGARIAELRESRGMSQGELRRLTRANIWRIEHGYYRPQVSTLEKIACELGVSVAKLFSK